jgi:hypothetical protein
MKKILKKIKEIENKLDINNKYPNYANKKIFWLGFIILIFFIGFMLYNYGLEDRIYIECDSKLGCKNPYIYCENYEGMIKPSFCEYYLEV